MNALNRILTILALALVSPWAQGQSFSLAPLPYAYDALAPVIDEQTMRIHHGRHHQTYVDNLNKAVTATPALAGLSIEALMTQISKTGEAVRNNGGGHWNHIFFWQSMTRPSQGGSPSPDLLAAITRDFGLLDQFKAAFKSIGLGRFGSGWVWLIVTTDGKLKVTATANQDNPLMDVVSERGQPLLGNDVWEHAYYLQYQNRRGDYLDAWWQVVDWTVVSTRYADAQKKYTPP